MSAESLLSKPVWNNRTIFSMIWPLMIEQVLAVTMGAVDTVMVSSVGEFAVSGVNIVDNINNLLIIAFAALCTGGSVVVSQYIGRRDAENSRMASRQLVYTVAVVSLIIMIFALVFRKPLIRLIYGKLEADVMQAASAYLLVTALSFPMLAFYNAAAALFRAAGNSKVTMRIALMVNILNITGNILLIFGLKLGVIGAALSTLISRTVAAIVSMRLLAINPRSPVSLTGLRDIRYARGMVRTILNVGIPSGMESSMFQVGRLLTQRIFTAFGTAAIAGNAIASVINSLSFMPGMAFGLTLLTVVGQCVGAGDYEAAKKSTARIMKMSYGTIFVTNLLIYVFMEPLIGLFNLSPEAHRYARSFLQIHCVSMAIGWVPSFALPNALRAAGDARYVMIAATVSMWVVRVSAAYFLCFVVKTGPIGVWIAMGGDFIGRGVSYMLRWRGGKWQSMRVIGS